MNLSSERAIIYADPHEKETDFLRELLKYNVEVNFTLLPCDYYIDGIRGSICVERKAVSDFINSLETGRLFEQIYKTKLAYPDSHYLFLIHGYWERAIKWTKININAIYSALSSLMIDWKCSLLHFPRIEDCALYLAVMATRISKPKDKVKSPIYKPKAKTIDDVVLRIISGFPHISTTLGKRILKKYKTLRNALNNVHQWHTIKGIGRHVCEEAMMILDHIVSWADKSEQRTLF
ncbi:MAG: ERCC4 domain-containing protein [Candidatus Geothermarchaeota archaeon]